jgi:putative hemolysin
MKYWQKDLIALGVVILLVAAVSLKFTPDERPSNQIKPIIAPETPSPHFPESPSPVAPVCNDGETRDATCPDGVTTYLYENCVDGEWHQVTYIRNPCEQLPTTTLKSVEEHVNETLSKTGVVNPASVYCEERGGQVIIRTDENGSQTGYCVLENGIECEEWAYFRQECPN